MSTEATLESTAMTRRNVWGREFASPLNTLQGELHRLYDHYRTAVGTASAPGAAEDADAPVAWTPALDLYETPEEVGLIVDLPGVDPASIEVSVTGRVLTLRGEKPRDEPDRAEVRTLERVFGPFFRQVDLPGDVNVDAVQAEARHGVLVIRLPKVEAARARTIPIQVT